MATVIQGPTFNHEETQRRVRHPLHLLRKYIRRYIILEGVALTLLCASLLFWLGLAFDFGLYKFDIDYIGVHGIDWIQEFNELDPTGNSSFFCRVILLAATVAILLFLGITRVAMRWLREFNDRALALVLERRFPKQLGDRLITAVELADPKLSKRYGYSQAMVEKTILEAVETLKQLPISSVFNWGRLVRLWCWLGAATVGMYLLLMIAFCVGSFFTEGALTPFSFTWKFYDVATIWTERNVLMMNTYWPRRAHLELVRFQPALADKSEMRVARDDARPDLQVRAIEWVIADRKEPSGWRALQWSDLAQANLVPPASLSSVTIAKDFGYWKIDPDELEPNLAAALFGTDTQARSSATMRTYLMQEKMQRIAKERGAEKLLADWLDWNTWTLDKLALQMTETDVRNPLRETADYANLEAIFAQLKEQAESPAMSRTLRKLVVPTQVEVAFRGEESGSRESIKKEDGNKYTVRLQDLKDSTHFRLRVRGEDYYTPPKTITLMAAPAAQSISIDKEEPAYIYHHLLGVDQMALQGEKHKTKDLALSTTGDTNTIEVPLGTNLTIHVQVDNSPLGWGGLWLNKIPGNEGLSVTAIDPGTPGKAAGLKVNDVILKVNGAAVPTNLDSFAKMVKEQPARSLAVLRQDEDESKAQSKPIWKAVSIELPGMPAEVKYSPRRLRGENAAFVKDPVAFDPGFATYGGAPPVVDADRSGFSLELGHVTRKHDFSVEFFDEDNIRGKRRFRILSVIDLEPQLGNLNVFSVNLRKPKFKAAIKADKDPERDPRDLREQAELAGAFLITPNALIPLECPVKDDYGLVRVGYNYKIRKVDFELIAQGGKKLPNLEVDQVSRRYRSGLAVGNLRFWPGDGIVGAWHLAWTSSLLESDIRQSEGYKEAFVKAEAFDGLLERKRAAGKMIFPAELAKKLKEKGTVQPWEFDFKDDDGFDVRKLLPQLKAVDLEKFGQSHYYLQLSVQATDNNVETGATFFDESDPLKELKGNTKKNKNGLVSFIVISENELLSQIALEEELLQEKLEAAKEKVDAGITSLQEQHSKVANAAVDMDNVLNRMNEIRTALGSAANNLRESQQAYNNILRELEVNRVRSDRVSKIRDNIIARLDSIVLQNPIDPQSGSLPRAQEAFDTASQQVEKDVNDKAGPNVALHRQNMADAGKQLNKLSYDINQVLLAMSEGIAESKLIALIASIEQQQRAQHRMFEAMRLEATRIALEGLIGEEKKDEKKK